jgi:spore germination cell wall hydrolase CwlJ-like protein
VTEILSDDAEVTDVTLTLTDTVPFGDPGWRMRRRRRRHLALALLAALLAILLAIGGVAYLMLADPGAGAPVPDGAGATEAAAKPGQVTLPVPPVEPVELLPVTPDDARAANAKVPFSTAPNPPARPLVLALAALDQQRAIDCLAAAAWYEAGDDAVGEQAVIQVVLNRARHPAFPKTLCGVVFQGSERTTGCQFSFSCDGSMARTPSQVAWLRARSLATAAVNGLVFRPVGYATHYHTDWVVPNWSSSVDKITAIHTHLFFRWRDGNGQPRAFTGVHPGTEPVIAKLARLSPAHSGDGAPLAVPTIALTPGLAAPLPTATMAPVDPGKLRGNALAASDASANLFVVRIKPDQPSGGLAIMALGLCRGTGEKACTVTAFLGEPGRVVADSAGRASWPDRPPDFYYFRDPSRGRETALWNCTALPRPKQTDCMPPGYHPAG